MPFEDICARLSHKSSLTRNPQEKKTDGPKLKQNNLSWIYKFFKHVFGKQGSLDVNFRDECLNHKPLRVETKYCFMSVCVIVFI